MRGLCRALAAGLWLALGGVALAGKEGDMRIESPAFADGGEIPRRFTCDGEDLSPALRWSGVPAGTRSLLLIVEDPDAPDPAAPQTVWVHWLLYNMPPTVSGLPEGVDAAGLPPGTREGINDWKRPGWGGPCPPVGRHRYFFRLFALDTELPDLGLATRSKLLQAKVGHVLAEAELVATYRR